MVFGSLGFGAKSMRKLGENKVMSIQSSQITSSNLFLKYLLELNIRKFIKYLKIDVLKHMQRFQKRFQFITNKLETK